MHVWGVWTVGYRVDLTSMFPWEILYENVFKALLLELQDCPEKVLLTSCLEGIVLTASMRRDRVRGRSWGGIECWGS